MKPFEKFLFYLLIFSIPFQTRVFLYSANVVEGFNEWQSIFVYGTDILIGLLFLYWLLRWVKGGFSEKISIVVASLVILLIFAGISVYFAPYWEVGLYRFIKLVEFIWLFFYTIFALRSGIKFGAVALSFGLSGIVQGIIAIWQFLIQRSIGLRFLGEPPLEAGAEEVAEIVAYGARFMRAYGTFTSPNVLAAFLAVSILLILTWYISRPYRLHRHFFFASSSLIIMGLALFLTFSRAVIGIFGLVAAFYFLFIFLSGRFEKRFKIAGRHILLVLILAGVVFGGIYGPELYSRFITNVFELRDLSIVERGFWTKLNFEILAQNPMGVGIGNSTLFFRDMYPGLRNSLYQPEHNIFLLMAVEAGIVAALTFLLFMLFMLYKSIRNIIKKRDLRPRHLLPIVLLLFFIGTGLFDHYYLTLQQGSLMFWLGLGVVYYLNQSAKL